MSPAQRHKARALAAQSATAVAASPVAARPTTGAAATEYEMQRARLGVDLRRLKEIQSIEKKIELKRDLLPEYAPWIDGVLDAAAGGARGVQDDILVQVMIWRIDVGDYDGAFPLIDYVLRWSLALPERFNRTAATLIVEEIAEAALKSIKQGEDFNLELLQRVEAVGADHDMHDQVRAKLMKALGLQIARGVAEIKPDADGPAGQRRAGIDAALRYLHRAQELNSKVGVVKEIERLERLAKTISGEGASNDGH
ncbi:MAG: 38, BuPhKL3 [Novosphingobium sp.]|nr:38, BuPhKL3 [Novosphingobium sp.]